VLQWAAEDARVVAGAIVGSLAFGEGDRWSDLDLTFAVADEIPLLDVLEDWTRLLVKELDAVKLFDLPSGASIYRVFMLPGCLQFDLSLTPAAKFGARSAKFKLLFGETADIPLIQPPSAEELFGYAVHHLLRARSCIERNRPWQAEYWISAARDYALNLACHRLGLPVSNGRGYDALPVEVRDIFKDSFIPSLERDELMRTLAKVIEALLQVAGEVTDKAHEVEPQLRLLMREGR
jgi:hypothetical protein